MKNKQYKVTLDEKIVDKAQKKVFGAKLSPIIDNLLRAWLRFPEIDKYLKKIVEEDDKKQS